MVQKRNSEAQEGLQSTRREDKRVKVMSELLEYMRNHTKRPLPKHLMKYKSHKSPL